MRTSFLSELPDSVIACLPAHEMDRLDHLFDDTDSLTLDETDEEIDLEF